MGTPLAGDAFLILASDGLLQAADPDEVCGLADALALGAPLPKPAASAPVAIPLGPSAGSAGSHAHAVTTPRTTTFDPTGADFPPSF